MKYIDALKKQKMLQVIETEVSPDLEITEITDRVSKKYGKALLFTNVKGSKYPLLINGMGTYERLNLAFGVKNLDEIGTKIGSYFNLSSYATWMGKIKAIPKFAPLVFIFPRTVRKAACQEVIEEPNLEKLPIIKCWPQDGGKYLTLPLVFTKDPETGQQNVGMYRLQVYDKQTTGMHWHLHKDGRAIYDKYRKLGRKMPVSVALGCDPTVIYAATAPLPKMIDEMIFAGYLRKRPMKMVRSITNEIKVPADAEFVLEGYVDLDESRVEGPFGDHTGYYSLADAYPVFHIDKITRKKNPVYPTTIVGQPPMEDCYLGKATERIFLPLLKFQVPEIIDMDFPLEGVFHNCVIVSIKKKFPLHGKKIMNSLWGIGQMMYTKMLIIVEETVNVHDYQEVLLTMMKQVNHPSHIVLSEGPLDALDHASNLAFQGYRMGIDATKKLKTEVSGKTFLDKNQIEEVFHHEIEVKHFLKEDGKKTRSYLEACAKDENGKHVIILVDKMVDENNWSQISWKIFNNIDPIRDLFIKERKDHTLFIGIDATKKGVEDGLTRPWPDDIIMSEEIKKMVSRKWEEYGFNKE
jgi:4-hydroxy-3-polyprenylbenzoate decarboxylase